MGGRLVWSVAAISYALSTALGSRRDARQAGSKQATAATRIIVAATPATVGISVGPTPNSSDAINRLRAKAPASPTTTPSKTIAYPVPYPHCTKLLCPDDMALHYHSWMTTAMKR